MSNRLNQEREQRLQPKRMKYAKEAIERANKIITFEDDTKIQFLYKGNICTIFPYSGWFSGKGLVSGRGIDNLLKQLK